MEMFIYLYLIPLAGTLVILIIREVHMNKRTKIALRLWTERIQQGAGTVPHIPPGPGVWDFRGNSIDWGGVRLAEATFHRESSVTVRLTTPSNLRRLIHLRTIRKALTRSGVLFFTAGREPLRVAGVRKILRVVATHNSPFWPEALLRCEVDASSWRENQYRKAYFLSGYDRHDYSYFLCELPPGSAPRTLDEAYEALKPEAVKQAEQFGRTVKRQGDIFAVPLMDLPPESIAPTYYRMRILNTNHIADEAILQGGQWFARGRLRHRPAGREPDHADLKLGNRWHLIVKNTVPTAGS